MWPAQATTRRAFTRNPSRPPDPVQILFAGKLSRTKGASWLMKALARIDAPDWHLTLVGGGSGEEQEEVLQAAARLGERVTVTGPIDQSALAARMRKAHIFVLPSFFEGLPLVLLEALASGCRLVATALPGVREFFEAIPDPALRLVALPPMADIETPDPNGAGDFIARLATKLSDQLNAAIETPIPDLSAYGRLLASYTWDGVFRTVEAVYDWARSGKK